MNIRYCRLVAGAALVFITLSPAMAEERGHWHGDIHRFHEHDLEHWRHGRWFHGIREGRDGWWWIVGGVWYFYPAPIYPYPDPYTPPGVVVETLPAGSVSPYWYYCANPAGYYPYVSQCLAAWQRVAPSTAAQPVPAQAAPVQPPMTAPLSPQALQPPSTQPGEVVPPPSRTTTPPIPLTGGQQEQDNNQFNSYGAEFSQIVSGDTQASLKLKRLQAQVEAFRQALFLRNYNAMSLLKDTENLEQKISEQRKKLPKKKKDSQKGETVTPPSPISGSQ